MDDTIQDDKDLEFYMKEHGMFLADFWNAGNSDLKIEIGPRNVESGRWYTATWMAYKGVPRQVTAQRHKLLWERIIKRFLQDERETEGMVDARAILDEKESKGSHRG